MPTGCGTLKRFIADKGFGFVAPDDGTPDLFAPKRTFIGAETDLKEGIRVTYTNELEQRTNKPFAASWSLLDGAGGAVLGGLSACLGVPAALPGTLPAYGAMPATAATQRFSPYGVAPVAGYATLPAALPAAVPSAVPATVPVLLPGVAATGGIVALPPGWEQVTDPATGNPYYCNRATGESSWTVPVAAAAPAALPPALAALAVPAAAPAALPAAVPTVLVAAATQPAAAPALSPGWESTLDAASGKVYYFNRATGQSSWTPV